MDGSMQMEAAPRACPQPGEMEGPRGSGGGLAGFCAGGSPFFSQRAAWPCLCLSGLGRAALAAGGLAAAQCRGLFAGAGRGVGHDDAGPGPLASATGPGLAEDGLHTGCGGRADPAGGRSPAQSRLPQGRGLRSPCPGARLSAGLGPAVAAGRLRPDLLLLHRLVPGWGAVQALLAGLWAGLVYGWLADRRRAPVWRRRIWLLFSCVFFGQLLAGLFLHSLFLLQGVPHLPVPGLILSGPLYRAGARSSCPGCSRSRCCWRAVPGAVICAIWASGMPGRRMPAPQRRGVPRSGARCAGACWP